MSRRSLAELIPLSDFSGTLDSLSYVIRAHTSGLVTAPMKYGEHPDVVHVKLDVERCEILCAYPLTSLPRKDGGVVATANLGLLGRMTGCAAIVSNAIMIQDNGRIMVDTKVKALGVLGKYRSLSPGMI